MFDPKTLAESIVAGKDPELEESGEAPEATTEELAAEDVMAAFQENDPKALAAALRSFINSAEASEPPEVESKE
jgi:hypothetical protein